MSEQEVEVGRKYPDPYEDLIKKLGSFQNLSVETGIKLQDLMLNCIEGRPLGPRNKDRLKSICMRYGITPPRGNPEPELAPEDVKNVNELSKMVSDMSLSFSAQLTAMRAEIAQLTAPSIPDRGDVEDSKYIEPFGFLVEKFGSVGNLAKILDKQPCYVSSMINGRIPVGKKLKSFIERLCIENGREFKFKEEDEEKAPDPVLESIEWLRNRIVFREAEDGGRMTVAERQTDELRAELRGLKDQIEEVKLDTNATMKVLQEYVFDILLQIQQLRHNMAGS
jgi:hypothetical protein